MILYAMIMLLMAPFSFVSDLITISHDPVFYFQWVTDVADYFAVIRYVIPFERLKELFLCIIALTVIRIGIALMKLIFGKIIPIW